MRRDPTDIRALERERERDDLKAKLSRDREIEDFKQVVSSEEGRRFMWRLLGLTGVFRSSFTGNSETFFREGQRNVGLILIGEIHEHCPDVYVKMLKEQKSNDD